MILADRFLARCDSPYAAYMSLQRALMTHYSAQGGSPELWCASLAPTFRRRYAYLLARTAV